MKILALDLARRTGWAVALDGALVASGVDVFGDRQRESAGMGFFRFRRWLEEMVAGADLVVREAPLVRQVSGAAATSAFGFETRVIEVCDMAEVRHTHVHAGTLKKWATGKGNAKKPEMCAVLPLFWPDLFSAKKAKPAAEYDDNQADALLILAWAVAQFEEKLTPEAGKE